MEYDSMIGNPAEQADHWAMQTYTDDCAVMAQVSLLDQFGIHLTEDQAVYECTAHGWYTPGGGTLPQDVGNLMDLHGISTHDVQNATVADLATELQQGHGVIVGVRSDDLWDQGALGELMNWLCEVFGLDNATFSPADHAVVVTGVDVSDPSAPMVIINDSGTPDGQGHPYPLDKFMDAWENSNFSYTATDVPMPRDSDIMGDLDMLDVGKWVVGGVAAAITTYATGGDFVAGMEVGVSAASAVESLFSDSDVIRSI